MLIRYFSVCFINAFYEYIILAPKPTAASPFQFWIEITASIQYKVQCKKKEQTHV